MILEIKWLVLLVPIIICDFSKLRIEFSVGSKKVVLRGSLQPRLQLIQGKYLLKALQLPIELCKVQWCSLMVNIEKLNEKKGRCSIRRTSSVGITRLT